MLTLKIINLLVCTAIILTIGERARLMDGNSAHDLRIAFTGLAAGSVIGAYIPFAHPDLWMIGMCCESIGFLLVQLISFRLWRNGMPCDFRDDAPTTGPERWKLF